jgi:hypothetical protein
MTRPREWRTTPLPEHLAYSVGFVEGWSGEVPLRAPLTITAEREYERGYADGKAAKAERNRKRKAILRIMTRENADLYKD